MTTRVVHSKKEPYDVYIGRPSKWGNPFVMKNESEREAVVTRYAEWVLQQPELLADIHTLKGKTLGCWCAPRLCHGHVLAALADQS